MKYGQKFRALSVPQWSAYNVDYNELKVLIKENTTQNSGQARAIPGQVDPALAKFEDAFFHELSNQHDRVDLFVKDKTGAIGRNLRHTQNSVNAILSLYTDAEGGTPPSRKTQYKLVKYDNSISKCSNELKDLQKFIGAQKEAFRKILKKYKKWTGSVSLSERFNSEVLSSPKSFTKRDLNPLISDCENLLTTIRAATPDISESSTPRSRRSRRTSVQIATLQAPQRYWNEYDDGNDNEDGAYTVYVDPDDESNFPGAKVFSTVMEGVKAPIERMMTAWFKRKPTQGDRQPLLGSRPGSTRSTTETDDETSSSEFPNGYATHYATLPSIRDQKNIQARETLLFRGTIGGFAAALILLVIAGLLISTGKHKLRVEVDAGAIVGMVASLFFATLGLGSTLCRQQRLSWFHRGAVWLAFTLVCIFNGMLLVLVAGNTAL